MRESAATGPQPIVCTIDVSGVVPLKDKRAAARAKRKSSTAKTRISIKAPSKRRTEAARQESAPPGCSPDPRRSATSAKPCLRGGTVLAGDRV